VPGTVLTTGLTGKTQSHLSRTKVGYGHPQFPLLPLLSGGVSGSTRNVNRWHRFLLQGFRTRLTCQLVGVSARFVSRRRRHEGLAPDKPCCRLASILVSFLGAKLVPSRQ
jgi:hypothetical protein